VWALVSSLDLASASAQPRSAADRAVERWLERAERLEARGRLGPAANLLRRALESAPTDPRPLVRLVALRLPLEPNAPLAVEPTPELRAEAGALAARFDGLVLEGDATESAYRALAARVRRLGPWATALTGDHRSAIDRAALSAGLVDHVAADTLRRLGALAARRHDLIAADRALVAAGRADATDVTLITDLAAIRLSRGRADDAIRLLLEAIRRRPENTAIERDLAGAFLAAGRTSEGLARFAAIASTHPEDARAHLDLARAALEAGRAERATQAARAALERAEPRDPEPALVLAAARLAAQDEPGARAAFQEAIRRDPGNVRARRGLTRMDTPAP